MARTCTGPTSDDSYPCHCNPNQDNAYKNVYCRDVIQSTYEQTLSIILFIYVVMLIAPSVCYWLYSFWGYHQMKEYKLQLRHRRQLYIIISYALILACLVIESISTLYLYCNPYDNPSRKDLNYWTNWNGIPIIYSLYADTTLHILFWFGFWLFLQLKVYKLLHYSIFV